MIFGESKAKNRGEMTLYSVRILLVICILLVGSVEAERKKSGEKKRSHSTDVDDQPQDPRYHHFGKWLGKTANNALDAGHAVVRRTITRARNDKKSKGRKTVYISKHGRYLNIGRDDPDKIYGKDSKALCIEVLDKNKHTRFREIKPIIRSLRGNDYSKKFTQLSSTLWKCIDRNTAYVFFILEREFRGTTELKDVYIAKSSIKAWPVQLNAEDVDTYTKHTAQFNEKLFLTENRNPIRYIGKIKQERPDPNKWGVAKRNHRSQSGSETDEEEEEKKPTRKARKKIDSDEEEYDREKGKKKPDGKRRGKEVEKTKGRRGRSVRQQRESDDEEEEEYEQPPKRKKPDGSRKGKQVAKSTRRKGRSEKNQRESDDEEESESDEEEEEKKEKERERRRHKNKHKAKT